MSGLLQSPSPVADRIGDATVGILVPALVMVVAVVTSYMLYRYFVMQAAKRKEELEADIRRDEETLQ